MCNVTWHISQIVKRCNTLLRHAPFTVFISTAVVWVQTRRRQPIRLIPKWLDFNRAPFRVPESYSVKPFFFYYVTNGPLIWNQDDASRSVAAPPRKISESNWGPWYVVVMRNHTESISPRRKSTWKLEPIHKLKHEFTEKKNVYWGNSRWQKRCAQTRPFKRVIFGQPVNVVTLIYFDTTRRKPEFRERVVEWWTLYTSSYYCFGSFIRSHPSLTKLFVQGQNEGTAELFPSSKDANSATFRAKSFDCCHVLF